MSVNGAFSDENRTEVGAASQIVHYIQRIVMSDFITFLVSVMTLAGTGSGAMLDELPVASGGDPTGIWDADSLEIDVYATPALRAAVSDLVLSVIVDGQLSIDADGNSYRSEYLLDLNVSLTILGGPLAVQSSVPYSEPGLYSIQGSLLVFTSGTAADTVGFSVDADTLALIQEVPLGDFSTLAASLDPGGGPPLAVVKFHRVQGTVLTADFDGNGGVDFFDFLAFAAQFGRLSTDPGFDGRFDLDSDGTIGFTDFLVFVSQFGG